MSKKIAKSVSLSEATMKFLEEQSQKLFGYINLSSTIDYMVNQIKAAQESDNEDDEEIEEE